MGWKDSFPKEKRCFETERGILYHGDALKVLGSFPDNSIDAVVTDPPYGLRFMGQKWDYDVPSVELWKEVLRVLKPGGHLLSFFGTRTYHRGAVNIEDAGFEMRDMVLWLYGEGFPKGQAIDKLIDKELGFYDKRKVIIVSDKGVATNSGSNIYRCNNGKDNNIRRVYEITEPATPEAKRWQGWNTALKPACEPIVLARKPISEKNIAQNVLKWGTGGLNVDECRVGSEIIPEHQGRFPANVILDEEVAKMLDEQSGISKSSYSPPKARKRNNGIGLGDKKLRYGTSNAPDNYGDSGGASRFFYVAKAGRKERFFLCKTCGGVFPQSEYEKHKDHDIVFHPTVKPIKLIRYLIKLITPPDGVVLDLFLGSGTTAVACEQLGCRWIGIELNKEYCEMAKRRILNTAPLFLLE